MKRAVFALAGVLTVVSAVGFVAPAEAQKSNVTIKNSSDEESLGLLDFFGVPFRR